MSETNPSRADPLMHHSTHHLRRRSGRRTLSFVLVLVVLFVFQTGLVPFDFGPQGGPNDETRGFFVTFRDSFTVPDTISNVFLYVPVGMVLAVFFGRRRRGSFSHALRTVGSAGLLSFTIEWLQAYSPRRVSSRADLAANIAGAVIGWALLEAFHRIGPRLRNRLQLEYRGRPRTLLVQAYCALLLFFAAVPFSLSLDVAHLKRSVKQVNVVPFAEVASPTPALKTAGAGEADLYRQWLRFKQGSRWAAEALSFLILAWGLRKVFRREYRFPSVSAALLTLWIGCGMMLAVNIMHLLVVSRVCDVTDALVQGAGLLLGMAVPIRADGSHSPRTHGHDRRLQLRLSRFALIGVAGWIAFNGLLPLAFRFESGRWTQALRSHDLLPFFAYFHARMPVMLDDLAEKLVSFAVLGGVWAWGRSLAGERHPSAARAAWYGTLVATGIEIAQIYLPLRVPSLTDVILGGAGSAFGAVTWRHTRRLFRDIVKRPRRTGHKLPPPSTLSPFEELLASLAEPDENAPRESLPPVSSPRRRGTPPSDPIR